MRSRSKKGTDASKKKDVDNAQLEKQSRRQLQKLNRLGDKIFVITLTIAFGVLDVLILSGFFEYMYDDNSEANIYYALVLASSLNISALLFGVFLTQVKDETQYKANDKKSARIGLWISAGALTLAVGFFLIFRVLTMVETGTLFDFLGIGTSDAPVADTATPYESYQGDIALMEDAGRVVVGLFSADIFRTGMPLMSSTLLIATSWWAFRTDNISKLKSLVDILRQRFRIEGRKYNESVTRLDSAIDELWTTLTNHKYPPGDLHYFNYNALARAKDKITQNGVESFKAQLRIYNNTIEYLLQEKIDSINSSNYGFQFELNKLTSSYDAKRSEGDSEEMWNLESSADNHLIKRLVRLISNDIVVEQTRTRYRIYDDDIMTQRKVDEK